jgi:acyl-coenzyme A thioesterase PaaI-like protein
VDTARKLICTIVNNETVTDSHEPATHESIRTFAFRHMLNLWPCYRGTGGRVTFISSDWRRVNVRLKLGLRTRNYVGTIFGGSLYGAIDPIYMLMLIQILGPAYVVWDKAANIRFKKPGRGTLEAQFFVTEEEIATIRELSSHATSIDRIYSVEFKDRDGQVIASIDKTIYIKRKLGGDI